MKLLRNFLFLLCGIFIIAQYNVVCHECKLKNGTMDCSMMNLTSIPKDLSKNTVALHLSYNFLTKLTKDDFSGLPKLKYLNLDFNPITTISPEAFNSMLELEELHISSARIKIITREILSFNNLTLLNLDFNQIANISATTFSSAKSLKELRLRGNLLERLDADTFSDLTNLQNLYLNLNYLGSIPHNLFPVNIVELNLANNRIESVNNVTFHNLKKLDLSYQKLKTFPVFKQVLEGLQELNVINCDITAIPSSRGIEKPFDKTPNLKILRLNGNAIENINEEFPKSLEELILLSNKIESVSNEAFKKLNKLKYLNLGRNQIKSLDEDIFYPLSSLKELSLVGNSLTGFQAICIGKKKNYKGPFLKNIELEKLYLSYNGIGSMEKCLFQNLKNLKELFINGNKMSSLPNEIFKPLKNLELLQMDNLFVTKIQKELFSGNTNLKELFINDITTLGKLDNEAFIKNINLERLHLSKTSLTDLGERVFSSLVNLTDLNLKENSKIKNIQLNLFSKNENLTRIDLSDTTIESIAPTTFEKQTRLLSLRFNIKMYCTYRSLNQMKEFKEKRVLKDEFQCKKFDDINKASQLLDKEKMSKYFDPSKDKKHSQKKEVYVSRDGSRSPNCGSQKEPCHNIADVLFGRHHKITVYLDSGPNEEVEQMKRRSVETNRTTEATEAVPYEYQLLLPLNLIAEVTFKSYPENSSERPVITTDQPRLFIIRNNQSFTVDNVDFRLPNKGVLLEIDSVGHFLRNVTLKNTEIKTGQVDTVKGIYMKNFQSIKQITVKNMDIFKGSLVEIQGNKYIDTTNDRNPNIGHLDVDNVRAEKIISFDKTFRRCSITSVNIHNCNQIGFGLYFVNSICHIGLILINDTKIKHTAVHVMKQKPQSSKRNDDTTNTNAYDEFQKIGRYLKNLQFSLKNVGITKSGKNIIERIQMEKCTMTTAIEISNMDVPFTINSLIIRNSSMENGLEITETSFEANNVVIMNNSIARNIYQQKRGDLKLENLLIKTNSREDISKALIYQAGTNTNFTMTNATIEWANVNNTHPPLVDIYLGDGFFTLQNASITSYSIYGVTVAAIEIGSEATLKSSIIKDIILKCTDNSNSSHHIEGSIRGNIMYAKCDPCEINTYTRQRSFLKLEMETDLNASIQTDESSYLNLFERVKVMDRSRDFKCHNCPIGGSCKNGIVSSGNFYGYSIHDGTVVFKTCPKNYCCSMKDCYNIDSCRFNRVGVLCGSCVEGYQEDLFSENCIKIKDCKNNILFWILFVTMSLIVCVIFLFFKDIIMLCKSCGIYIKLTGQFVFGNLWKCLKICFKSVFKMKEREEAEEMGTLKGTEYGSQITASDSEEQNQEESEEEEEEEEEEKEERKLTMSGCFNIIVGFYQIRSLLTVDVGEKYEKANTYQEDITKAMNLDSSFVQSYCPWKELTPIGEGFIINQLAIALMLGWAIFILFIHLITKKIKVLFSNRNNNETEVLSPPETPSLRFSQRVGIGIIKIIMFGYKSVATFAIVMVHCVDIKGDSVMFINGDMKCHTPLQYASYALIILWVIPFPAALMMSYRMYMTNRTITMRQFVISLIFPWVAVYFWLTRRCFENNNVKRSIQEESREENVRSLLHEIFQEAYRKRVNKGYNVFWETWRLYQRLILAVVTTYAINPVERICFSAPIILFFIFVYWFVKPYGESFVVLHWMEVVGLLGITFTLVNNMFRSFLYVFEIPDEKPVPQSLSVLWAIDTIASPIFVLPFMYGQTLVKFIWKKRKEYMDKKCN